MNDIHWKKITVVIRKMSLINAWNVQACYIIAYKNNSCGSSFI